MSPSSLKQQSPPSPTTISSSSSQPLALQNNNNNNKDSNNGGDDDSTTNLNTTTTRSNDTSTNTAHVGSSNTNNIDDPTTGYYHHYEVIRRLGYILPIIKGITYPIFKVSIMALAEKLFRQALIVNIDPELYEQIQTEIYSSVSDSTITSLFLLYNLSFQQVFMVCGLLVVIISVVQPLTNAIQRQYCNYYEVKRLQNIIYKKLLLEPNSVNTTEAQDLVYSKIASIENYMSESKYLIVDDQISIVVALLLFLTLNWELGLLCIGGKFA